MSSYIQAWTHLQHATKLFELCGSNCSRTASRLGRTVISQRRTISNLTNEPKVRWRLETKSNSFSVDISPEERRGGKIGARNLQDSLRQFHQDGWVVLENAVDFSIIDHMREQMHLDMPLNLASPNPHFNHGKAHKNVSQTPPLLPEYMHANIWANPYAVDVMSHIIGPVPQLNFATSNIALPGGEGRQAVHSDYYCAHYDFPVFLEMCIFLDNVCSVNGSPEIWPGTHNGYNKEDHAYDDMGWIKQDRFVKRAEVRPPFQPRISKGSVVIRDLRMWHAGMPNFSPKPRIMLGFIYGPKWFDSQMRMIYPANVRDILASWDGVDAVSLAKFTEEHVHYLHLPQELNLSQERVTPESKYLRKHGTIAPGPDHYWTPDNVATRDVTV